MFRRRRPVNLTPKDAILFKIVHTCAKECLILTYIIYPQSLSLLAKPSSVRTPPTSRSGESIVSQHSASTRWWRRMVSLIISEPKCDCWGSVLKFCYKPILLTSNSLWLRVSFFKFNKFCIKMHFVLGQSNLRHC